MHTNPVIIHTPDAAQQTEVKSSSEGWVALMVMIVSGSTSVAFGKQLTEYFSPLSMLFLSEVMMLLFAVFSFGFIPLIKRIRRLDRTKLLPLVTAGVMTGVLAPLFRFWGLQHTSAVNTQLFGMTEMLFLISFGTLYAHQKFQRVHGLGGLIIVAGMFLVAIKGFSDSVLFALGDLGIITAGFFYAIGGTIICAHLRSIAPQVIILIRSLCAISFFFVLSPFIPQPFITEMRHFPVELAAVLLSYGLISRFLVVFSYYSAIERLPLPTISLLSTTSVAGAMGFAWLYLGETITWYHIAGAGLIMTGASVVQWTSIQQLEERFVHFIKTHHRQQM
ncbi:MAG: DMT family transporter [Candidatus Peribacteraceae bacterium]|nr:DMT family transporter [Candidatus Peribacteraceae bacterium]